MSDPVERAWAIIHANRYMTVATCDGSHGWASPIAYVVDSACTFYWYSATEVQHSRNITQNPTISAAFFDSTAPSDTVDGVQIEGIANVVDDTNLRRVADLYWRRSFPDKETRTRWMRPDSDFSGNAPQRFYRFDPTAIYILDADSPVIDQRISVSLFRLKDDHLHASTPNSEDTPAGLMIRPYIPHDYHALQDLYEQSGWFDPITDAEDRLARKIALAPGSILLAVENTVVVGSVSLIKDDRIAFLFRLVVKHDYDDKQIIETLVAKGREQLRRDRYTEVHVFALESDATRHEHYTRLGFETGNLYRWFYRDV